MKSQRYVQAYKQQSFSGLESWPKGEHKICIFHWLCNHAGNFQLNTLLHHRHHKTITFYFLGSRGASCRDVWDQKNFWHQHVRPPLLHPLNSRCENDHIWPVAPNQYWSCTMFIQRFLCGVLGAVIPLISTRLEPSISFPLMYALRWYFLSSTY